MAKKKDRKKTRAPLISLNTKQALAQLAGDIKENKVHRDHKRCNELRILYSQYITGIGTELLLKRFVQRETDEMFKQRCELTEAITPAVASTLMTPWYKVARVQPVVMKIDFENATEDDERISELQDYGEHYYGEQSVDDYLGQRYIDLNGTDPNAWLMTTFDPFNSDVEKASPYPIEISSEEAINFKFKNNECLWLEIKRESEYLKLESVSSGKKTYEKGCTYQIWTFNQAIQFTQVDINTLKQFDENKLIVVTAGQNSISYWAVDKTRLFQVDVFNHKAGMVPAFRVGVKPDLSTAARTFVNLFHPALPYFKKTIKTVSEMDLTMALHAFLQKISYQPKCPGTKENPCNLGKLPDGKTNCPICKGNGVVVITTTQDFITMVLPKDPDKMMDLSKLVHYVTMPAETPKFQDEYIDKLERKAIKAVYNSETLVNDTVVKTAMEKFIDLDSVYDALQPLATGYSKAWRKTYTYIAVFTDNSKGLIVEHKMSKDFKFKGKTALLNELKLAVDSGAPASVKQEIQTDITISYFIDRPDELKKLQVKQKFNPGEGKSETEVQYIISNNLWRRFDQVLYSEFKPIFQELEADQRKADPTVWFYDMAEEAQIERVKKKVAEFTAVIDAEKPAPLPGFGFGGNDNSGAAV